MFATMWKQQGKNAWENEERQRKKDVTRTMTKPTRRSLRGGRRFCRAHISKAHLEALESGRKRKRGFFNGQREEKLNFMLGVLSRAER